MKSLIIKDFSLEHTIDSGQFFLYFKDENDFYNITSRNNIIKIKQENDELVYEGIEENDLINFFSLDEDLNELTKDFEGEHLLIALEKYWGLRLIRQDLWQCIIGFVCSSASNIPKIKMNLKLLTDFFGNNGKFPNPGDLNDLGKIKEAKTGYRAKFIFGINEIVKENPSILNQIKEGDYKTSKDILMEFPGIGSKVADCICLFSLGHHDAFPIDTWVKQIIEKLYLKREAKNMKEIEEYIKNNFNGHKGLKQQYLFHYARLKKI